MSMTSKERMLAAIQCQPVDHVPMTVSFWGRPRHARITWNDERGRLAFYAQRGWDAYLSMWCGIAPSPEVRVEVFHEQDETGPVLRQLWHTPAGTLQERLRVTEDWPDARDATAEKPIGLLHDFRTPRYLEAPLKTMSDLETLPYLLPDMTPAEEEGLARNCQAARKLAAEFGVAHFLDVRPGLDWLVWLSPPAAAVLCALDTPEMTHKILDHVAAVHRQRVDCQLALGIDGIIRSGWYESTDLWSPELYRQLAVPKLAAEFAAVRAAGKVAVYLMDSGVRPLLPELGRLDFDCLAGVDPATAGSTDVAYIRQQLPGKSLWGGISGPLHLGRGTPAETERAVERAFATCGKTGFILGPCVGFRCTWPWENLEACDRAWKRLR